MCGPGIIFPIIGVPLRINRCALMKKWLIFLLVFLPFGLMSAQELRVMTFNIRFDYQPDTANSWSRRGADVAQTISDARPDVVGLQEVLHDQLVDILENLPGYQHLGQGRDDGKEAGEYSPILFRTERFRVLDHNQFWLSEQPNVPGSMSWGTACTRIATWAFLQDLQSLDTILVINTHFDHISEEARQHGAVMIDSFLRQQIIRDVWCLGDFNATLSDIALQPLENQYGEARQTAELTTGPSFTFHGFTGAGKEGHIIDHIFYKSPDWMIGSYEVITRVFKGHYPSDHFPVLAVFRHR